MIGFRRTAHQTTNSSSKPLQQRNQMMLGLYPRQRTERRYFLTAPVSIRAAHDSRQHVGLLRDMSWHGLFFFTDFAPAENSKLEITLMLKASNDRPVAIACSGTVVRTEGGKTGAAVGIAVRLDDLEFGAAAAQAQAA